MTAGWCDQYHKDGPEFRHTWHRYAQSAIDAPSLCNNWHYDPGLDQPLRAKPPESAKVCKTCLRLIASKETP